MTELEFRPIYEDIANQYSLADAVNLHVEKFGRLPIEIEMDWDARRRLAYDPRTRPAIRDKLLSKSH